MEIEDGDVYAVIVDEHDNEIGFILLDEDGNEQEYYYVDEDNDGDGVRVERTSDGDEFDLGISRDGRGRRHQGRTPSTKDGVQVAAELKSTFDEISDSLSFLKEEKIATRRCRNDNGDGPHRRTSVIRAYHEWERSVGSLPFRGEIIMCTGVRFADAAGSNNFGRNLDWCERLRRGRGHHRERLSHAVPWFAESRARACVGMINRRGRRAVLLRLRQQGGTRHRRP